MNNSIRSFIVTIAIMGASTVLAVPYVIIENNLTYDKKLVQNPTTGRSEYQGDTGVITIDLDINTAWGGLTGFDDKSNRKIDPKDTKKWDLKGTAFKSLTIERETESTTGRTKGRKITQTIKAEISDLKNALSGWDFLGTDYLFIVDRDKVTVAVNKASGSNDLTVAGDFYWANPTKLDKTNKGKTIKRKV